MTVDWRSDALPDGVDLRILFMRHGEPVESARGRCYGTLDVPLSSAGREQVARVAAHLKRIRLAAIYTSPRIRARETAQILATNRAVSPTVDPRLAEMDFGELEGRTYDDIERALPELFAEWMRRPTQVCFPGGESYSMLRDRVRAATREIRARHHRAVVAIIAHGGVVRAALAEDLGLDSSLIFRIDQSYGAISCVDHCGTMPIVRALNWLL